MEEQQNTISVEQQIIDTNLPIRKELVQALEALLGNENLEHKDELDSIKDRWENLGVPLGKEEDVAKSYSELIPKVEGHIQENVKKGQSAKDIIQTTLKHLEKFIKNSEKLTSEEWKTIQEDWRQLKLDDQSPEQQQYDKLEAKVSQKLKKFEHEDKCQLLEKLCSELEELKKDRNKKLSERQNQIRKVRDQFKDINLHSGPNVVTLRERFNTLNQELTQELSWERWSSSKRKEDLIQKATQLIEQEDTTQFREELQKLQAEWKEIGFTSRDDDKLWEQFKQKCDEVYQRLKVVQDENEQKREALLKQLEALKDSSDWKKATESIQSLQKEWNNAYPVSRKAVRKQGQVYKEICDTFFNRRRDHQKELRSNQKDNLKEKKLLIEEVTRLHKETNWKHSLPKVKDLQEKWKKTGPVPKKFSSDLWKEFQEACNVIYDKRRAENEEVDKEFEENAVKKNEVLEALKTTIEEATDLAATRIEISKFEKQWQEIGKVPRGKQKKIEHQYRQLLKDFQDKEDQAQKEKEAQLVSLTSEKTALCLEVEALLFNEDWAESAEKLKPLQEKWDSLGTSSIEKPLKRRYHKSLQLIEAGKDEKTSAELEALAQKNTKEYESLLLKLEQLAGVKTNEVSASAQRQMMIAELQAKMGKTSGGISKAEEAKSLIAKLQQLGPINPENLKSFLERQAAAASKIK